MKHIASACAATALLALPLAASAKAEPEFSFAGNAGLVSDYRFRGFTQTGYAPAFQGGFDFTHRSGFYLGNWNSNVEQGLYNGASLEMDFYGGYRFSAGDLGLDLGYLYYAYPNSGALGTTRIRNAEVYVGATYGPLSAKFLYGVTPFFSLGEGPTLGSPPFDTEGSYYVDLTANVPLGGGWTLNAHYGHQYIKNARTAFAQALVFADTDTIGDWKLGVTYDLAGWSLAAAAIGTTEKGFFRTAESGFLEDAGKTRLVVGVARTF